jgi:ABC-type nitrate/sulfonate/bicarbonate transport system, permease component
MAQQRSVELAVSPWLPLAMTIPTLVVVLVTMVLFQFSEAAVITATVLVTTPYATVTVWEGARTVDNDILSVAAAYDASSWAILREIYLPAIAPAVFGSARYLASMVWKVVVLAETFGMSVGMGAVFRFWYGQGDLEAVLAALFVFVFVMVGIQAGITHGKERLLAWQT